MKLSVLSITAAVLVSACATTAPEQRVAENAASCSSYGTTEAVKPSSAAIEATAHCSSAPWLTPDKLHERMTADSNRLRSQNIR
jgi:hypothetical protein